MAELLLELFSEEIPARMQDRAREDLARLLAELLTNAGLGFDGPVRTLATPRRLAAVVAGLPLGQAERVVERKGPRADAPEVARAGFLRGLQGLDYTLEEREEKKGRLIYALVRERGRTTAELLAELLPGAISRLSWPKSMRWGDGEFRWVRPLQSILCLLDGATVPFSVGGVPAGNVTRGHRFMAPEPFAVRDFADYVVRLREARVILDGAERRAIIAQGAQALAAAEGLAVEDDPALLNELKGLVEWPVPLKGAIDESFMALPAEALVTTMRTKQRYLALRRPDGSLAPRFVAVANLVASDGGAVIAAGNERVLRARLWDARFFWEQDLKVPLESRLPALDRIVFHAELGTLGERVLRLIALAKSLVQFVPGADRVAAERAARLAKADLVTGMVGEFPELQGIMGGYYARAEGEPDAVAAAICDQYAPKGPGDRCPTALASVVVALAEKLDTLAGFFGERLLPTGSKDPFALRRAALGVIRLIVENGLRFDLREAFLEAVYGYGDRRHWPSAGELADGFMNFISDRLKVHLREQGIRHDFVAAVLGKREGYYHDNDLVRLIARGNALQAFIDTEDGRNLLTAYRRASNIVAIEEKKDGRRYALAPAADALVEPAERDLHDALAGAGAAIRSALSAEDFAGTMAALATLRRPVDAFFDGVLVNSPDPRLRENRLLLLNQIRYSLQQVADFSLVEDVARNSA